MHACVVGAAAEYKSLVFPDGCQEVGYVCLGYVVNAYVPYTQSRDLTCYLIGKFLGVPYMEA